MRKVPAAVLTHMHALAEIVYAAAWHELDEHPPHQLSLWFPPATPAQPVGMVKCPDVC